VNGELPGGAYLSAMARVQQLQSNSVVKLQCGAAVVSLRLGERSGPFSLQQLPPDQVFLSLDTSAWINGCLLNATVVNGSEGVSEPHDMGRIVRAPKIEHFEVTGNDGATGEFQANLVGQNLEAIERTGWNPDQGEAVTGLPLPVAEGRKQTLRIRMPAHSDPPAELIVWLRGESKPRVARVHP
jgi:hypothetical protein